MAGVKDVSVQQSVLETIGKALPSDGLGLLIGEDYKVSLKVWRCTRLSERVHEDAMRICQLIPGGMYVLGLYRVLSAGSTVPNVTENEDYISNDSLTPTVEALMTFLNSDHFILFNYNNQNPHSSTMFLFSSYGDQLNNNKMEWTAVAENENLQDEHVRLRLKTRLSLSFRYDPKSDRLIKTIKTEVEELCKWTKSPLMVFHIKDSQLLLSQEVTTNDENKDNESLKRDQQKTGLYDPSETCEDIFKYIETNDENQFLTSKSKKQKAASIAEKLKYPVLVNMFTSMTSDTDPKQTPTCAPLIHQQLGDFKQVCIPLKLDVLAYVSVDCPIGQVAGILATAVCRQIRAAELCITEHRQDSNFSIPQTHHIQLPHSTFIVSVTYPESVEENSLEEQRKYLHQLFCLPLTAPYFRKGNAIIFIEDIPTTGSYLINPHVGIVSGIKGGKQHLVHGRYNYHHYMQDNFDDNKWGCAYRSLQTVISWFRLQGYTYIQVPSHRKIQQALVDMGDKQPSFVGSRQWIGSLEVSYCLDNLIGVQSRIMSVSSGDEMSSRGRELSMHFDTMGTPVMIGGGVLAHTIIGVDYNEVTGDIKFLILDPHYTGEEDLKHILDNGWCGWKGANFWDKHAHYNLCLPQKPNII